MKLSMKHKLFIAIGILIITCVYLLVSVRDIQEGAMDAAFGAEFLTRPDGYEGLSERYGFRFQKEPRQMVDGLLYKALASESVDIINAFSTDGRIPAYGLVCLKDDKNFFPPYYAAPLVRGNLLDKYPKLGDVLNRLSGMITNQMMQQMNYKSDEKGIKAYDIARQFLDEHKDKLGNKVNTGSGNALTVGSKEFTEQEVLGEILSQLIDNYTDFKVNRKLNLGGTIICFNALKAGDIDLYPEYTGTGLVNILKEEVMSDPEEVYKKVRTEFEKNYDLVWLEPFGFNNTYTLTVRKETANRLGLVTISDLAQYINSQ